MVAPQYKQIHFLLAIIQEIGWYFSLTYFCEYFEFSNLSLYQQLEIEET